MTVDAVLGGSDKFPDILIDIISGSADLKTTFFTSFHRICTVAIRVIFVLLLTRPKPCSSEIYSRLDSRGTDLHHFQFIFLLSRGFSRPLGRFNFMLVWSNVKKKMVGMEVVH